MQRPSHNQQEEEELKRKLKLCLEKSFDLEEEKELGM